MQPLGPQVLGLLTPPNIEVLFPSDVGIQLDEKTQTEQRLRTNNTDNYAQ